jgi:hypothetical protein
MADEANKKTEIEKKKTYEVLDPHAVFVAGSRIAEDRTVELFEGQARYPLLAETIRLASGKPARTADHKATIPRPVEG